MALWLVTGATGFVGRHVVEALTSCEDWVSGSDTEVILMSRR